MEIESDNNLSNNLELESMHESDQMDTYQLYSNTLE